MNQKLSMGIEFTQGVCLDRFGCLFIYLALPFLGNSLNHWTLVLKDCLVIYRTYFSCRKTRYKAEHTHGDL